MKGRLFVVSAPSGAGKTTLLKLVMRDVPKLSFSISHTTRSPRPGEVDGVDYHFVTKSRFEKMIGQGAFLEYARVHDNLYGTSSDAVEQQLSRGIDVILDIDVQGAQIIRKSGQIDGAFVFIAPPGLGELEKRLRGRGTESEEAVKTRMANAKQELQAAKEYEYLLINDDLEQAARVLSSIVTAERARGHRSASGEPITSNYCK
ncbi:guanylate kinase [Desulforhopalus singaporensis]|uniref:Guanylate kinase n=1 Tax=Desulforhopalus singaporensis TaxID=91360 RepID=A0A1H0THP4_9BACT|nr:guanylate kinase [Desulforhopalus singaporensis]SDP53365.1 guanylate kinase [Desulforhopalus singaporensis]